MAAAVPAVVDPVPDADELSEDSDRGDRINELQQGGAGGKKRAVDAKVLERGKGSKRVKAHEPPLPLSYKQEGDKFQKYSLPDEARVWNRREYVYDADHKECCLVTKRPAPPPTLFPDHLIMWPAKKLMLDTNNRELDNESLLLAPDKLNRRLEARVVRITNDNFKGNALDKAPSKDDAIKANQNIKLVFGVEGTWTPKQIMAWGWPEIPLTGLTQEFYKGKGNVTSHKRDSVRLISLVLLSAKDGDAAFSALFGSGEDNQNRFTALTDDVRAAANLLSTIVREGVCFKNAAGKLEERPGLAILFEEFEVHSLSQCSASARPRSALQRNGVCPH